MFSCFTRSVLPEKLSIYIDTHVQLGLVNQLFNNQGPLFSLKRQKEQKMNLPSWVKVTGNLHDRDPSNGSSFK